MNGTRACPTRDAREYKTPCSESSGFRPKGILLRESWRARTHDEWEIAYPWKNSNQDVERHWGSTKSYAQDRRQSHEGYRRYERARSSSIKRGRPE